MVHKIGILLETDKPLYKPGDDVLIRVFGFYGSSLKPPPETSSSSYTSEVVLEVMNPKSIKI